MKSSFAGQALAVRRYVVKKLSRKQTVFALSTLVAGSYLLVLAPGVTAKGSAKAGESLFAGKCAMCHGDDGSGNTPMGKSLKVRDLRSGAVQAQSDTKLYDIIANGKSPMPSYSQLGKQKIDDLVAYIRQLGKKK
jgi:mono/diheme cytochrome c family protein